MTVFEALARRLIVFAHRRAPHKQGVVTFDGVFSFYRFEFLWPDEIMAPWWEREKGRRDKIAAGENQIDSRRWTGVEEQAINRPPFWRPFNAFVHFWRPKHQGEEFHDHPRWSITVCLRGRLIERTPWSERTLKPGSIAIRSRKAIHAFQVSPEYRGKTWTLFIVGRRNHRQNRYEIKAK